MKTSESLKLIANGLAHEKNGKAKTASAGRELLRLAGKVEELERAAMLAALPSGEIEADALDGVGNLAREGEGGSADELAAVVERMAKANPDIARIIDAHNADGRVDWQAALLEAAMRLERQNAELARRVDAVAAAESDLTAVWMCGAERGRDAVAALRARIDELAEVFEERCLAYDAAAARCGKAETVSARQAWRWRSDLAFEVAEALNRLATPAENGPQAAGNGASVDFPGAGDARGQVSDKSQQAADLGRSSGGAENGQVARVCKIGAETAVEAVGGAQDG